MIAGLGWVAHGPASLVGVLLLQRVEKTPNAVGKPEMLGYLTTWLFSTKRGDCGLTYWLA